MSSRRELRSTRAAREWPRAAFVFALAFGSAVACGPPDPGPDPSTPPPSEFDPIVGTTAVGTIAANAGVTDAGDFTYSFPIEIPPGRAGMEPAVSVQYSSSETESSLGVGFAVSASSAITRCPRTFAQDHERRDVELTDGDRLCLDGVRLVIESGTYGAPNAQYRTEAESFQRVSRQDVSAPGVEGATAFVVELPDGRTRHYGTSEDSRVLIHVDGRVVVESWLLSEERDPPGNSILYGYTHERFEVAPEFADLPVRDLVQLQVIWYTGVVGGSRGTNAVIFQYADEPRRPARFSHAGDPLPPLPPAELLHHGSVTWSTATRPLAQITTVGGNRSTNTYYFRGDDENVSRRYRLNEVQRCTFGPAETSADVDERTGLVCMPSTVFSWRDRARAPATPTDFRYGEPLFERHLVALPRRAVRTRFVCGGTEFSPEICFEPNLVGALDFNGDGADDLMYVAEFPGTPTRYETRVALGVPSTPGDHRVATLEPGEIPFAEQIAVTVRSGISGVPVAPDVLANLRNWEVFDFNADGRDDILLPVAEVILGRTYDVYNVLQAEDDGFVMVRSGAIVARVTSGSALSRTMHYRAHLLDVNGDGRQDLLACQYDFSRRIRFGRDRSIVGYTGRWLYSLRGAARDGSSFGTATPVPGTTNCSFEYGSDAVARVPGDAEASFFAFSPSAGDFDGDGTIEIVVAPEYTDRTFDGGFRLLRWNHDTSRLEYEDTGLGWDDGAGWARLVVADLNGDGRHDLFMPHSPWSETLPARPYEDERTYVAYSTGRGFLPFSAVDPVTPPRVRNLDRGYIDVLSSARTPLAVDPFDFNGDGRAELLYATLPSQDTYPLTPFGNPDLRAWRAEEIYVGEWLSGTSNVTYSAGAFYGQLIIQMVGGSPEAPSPTSYTRTARASDHVTMDFDGDGALDLVEITARDSRVAIAQGPTSAFHNVRAEPSLLAEIRDGYGARTEVRYGSRADPDVYTPGTGCTYPQRCVTDAALVVRHLLREDGVGTLRRTSYEYVDGRIDLTGRGFVGYARVVATDFLTGLRTERVFDNVTRDTPTAERPVATGLYPFAGRAHHVFVTRSARIPDSLEPSLRFEGARVESSYEIANRAGPLQVRLVSTVQDLFEAMTPPSFVEGEDPFADLAATRTVSTTHSDFDSFGFAGIVRTVNADATATVRSTYEHSVGPLWRVGFLRERRTSAGITSLDTRCNRSVVERFANNLLAARVESTVRDPGDPRTERSTSYRYGSYGNVEAITTSAIGAGSRTIDIQWDPDGYFPIGVRNSLGHQTRLAVERWFGVVRAVVDPNAVESRRRVDGFGRERIDDDDTGARSEIVYSRTRASDGRTRVEVRSTDGHAAIELDRLTRPVVEEVFHARVHSVASTTFDDRGRVVRVGEPAPLGSAGGATTYEYDDLDRLRRVTHPESLEIDTYRYEPRAVFRRNGRRHLWVTRLDPRGNAASVTEPLGGGTSSYAYCVGGELSSVGDAEGNVTHVFYDRLGRRTRLDDPDSGEQTFEYDAWDELVRTFDGEGRSTRFVRDALGRLTDRRDDGDADHFHWDFDVARGPSGRRMLGLLAHAVSGDGVSDDAEYDDLGRLTAVRRTVADRTMTGFVTYDAFGHVESATAPSLAASTALTLHYTYDLDEDGAGSGEVVAMHGTLPALDARRAPLWELLEQDGHGGASRELLGDTTPSSGSGADWSGAALRRSTGYTAAGRIRSIVAGRSLSDVWQLIDYAYDRRGLLTTRSRYLGGPLVAAGLESESYVHDALGRLQTVTRGSAVVESYAYDAIGNLEESHDATLTYGEIGTGAGPHAVSTFAGDGGELWSVRYSAAGNATEIGSQTIAYNQLNLPVAIMGLPDGRAASASFEYAADGSRARKTSSDAETTYFGGHELELRGIDVRERTVITSPAGTIAQIEAGYVGGQSYVRLRWLLTDAQGTVEASGLADGAPEHHAYDAFGGVRAGDGSVTIEEPSEEVNHGYTGHEHEDDVGLVNMGGRVFHPILRRFLTADPLSGAAPQSLNRYSYVRNSPHNAIDPTGYQATDSEPTRPELPSNAELERRWAEFEAGSGPPRPDPYAGLECAGGLGIECMAAGGGTPTDGGTSERAAAAATGGSSGAVTYREGISIFAEHFMARLPDAIAVGAGFAVAAVFFPATVGAIGVGLLFIGGVYLNAHADEIAAGIGRLVTGSATADEWGVAGDISGDVAGGIVGGGVGTIGGRVARSVGRGALGELAAMADGLLAPELATAAAADIPVAPFAAEETAAIEEALAHIAGRTTPTGPTATNWGAIHYNRPPAPLPGPTGVANWLEFRVRPAPGTLGAGARRIVTDLRTGEAWYTNRHYLPGSWVGIPGFIAPH